MMRFAGSCFIALSGGIWGMYRSFSYRRRMERCGNILELIRKTENMIRYNGCEVFEIVRELSTYREFTEHGLVTEINFDGTEFSTSMCGCVEKFTDIEEKKIMLIFWREIGTTDLEGQLKMLEGLKESTVQLLAKRKAEYEKYGRLYRSVGFLLGIMAGIAVI